MIRLPAVSRARGVRLRKSFPVSLPSPVGGWNVRDPLAAMPETDAVVLENWFPKANDVELRPGVSEWTSEFASNPLTLFAWNGPSGGKLFAATATGIFDASAGTAVGPSLSTLTSGYLRFTNFATVGGSFLVAVNGQDALKLYNGTSWQDITAVSTPAITGLPTTDLTHVAVAGQRLWFVEKDSISAWYLPVGQIAGALTEFPLGQVLDKGGRLVAITNWTIDGGNGSDDYTIFISSEGQVAVYKGTDPSSSTTFSKVGTYYIGEPLGPNCFAHYGGDVLVLCQNGLFPLSKALQSATIDRKAALTDKIDTAFTEAATKYGKNIGWSVVVYPQGSFILVNIPVTSLYTVQYVMNSVTGAWCKFTGWFATSWEVFSTGLYMASNQKVGKVWEGTSDFGTAIVGKAQQAYSYLKARGRQKHIKLVRPSLIIGNRVTLRMGFDTDYTSSAFSSTAVASPVVGSNWDALDATWGAAVWGPGEQARRDWASVTVRECYAAAFRLQVSTASATLKWAATDIVYEQGGTL